MNPTGVARSQQPTTSSSSESSLADAHAIGLSENLVSSLKLRGVATKGGLQKELPGFRRLQSGGD
jgi:hypothetical protein